MNLRAWRVRWPFGTETLSRTDNRCGGCLQNQHGLALIFSSQISNLHSTVLAAETAQNTVNSSLDHIEQQQRELEATIANYEKMTADIIEGPGSASIRGLDRGPADTERDKK